MGDKSLRELSFESVESVHNVIWYLIWEKHRYLTMGFIIASIVLYLILLINFLDLFVDGGIFYSLVPPFLYYAYFASQAKKWFMQQFAEKNGMQYQETLQVGAMKGRLFKAGNDRKIEHVVSTRYRNHPLKLFHYSYSTGSGRNKSTHPFTVIEIIFEKVEFPHILLQSKTMKKFGAKVKGEKSLSLEEEYNMNYNLYTVPGYEIEIFQIFTHQVLRFLKEKGEHFSIEFADDRLYIYDDLSISNKKQLQDMYEVTQRIFDSIGALLNRLHDDFAVLHPYYKK
jgi:hypothetical protein